jgi:hypothetical protein
LGEGCHSPMSDDAHVYQFLGEVGSRGGGVGGQISWSKLHDSWRCRAYGSLLQHVMKCTITITITITIIITRGGCSAEVGTMNAKSDIAHLAHSCADV